MKLNVPTVPQSPCQISEPWQTFVEVKKLKGIPGSRGPAGPIDSAVRNAAEACVTYTDEAKKVSAEAQERANKLQAEAKAFYDDANERILTTANNVQSRLKVLEDRLASGDYLKEQILEVLQEYQIISEDSDAGALVKYHIEEAVRAATGKQTMAEQFGHLVPKP